MTSFELHPGAVSRLADGAESSFPERHFSSTGDEKITPTGVDFGCSKSTATDIQMLESSSTSSWSQDLHGRDQTLHHRNPTPSHGPSLSGTAFPPPLPRTTPTAHAEWYLYRESPAEAFWKPPQPEFVQDDSDSIQSPNDGKESSTTWPSSQKPRRQSMHRVTRPMIGPTPEQTRYITAPSNTPYGLDFEYSTDWLDFSDATLPFVPLSNHDNSTTDGGDTELIFDHASRSSKAASKRIAHKLSEKTRRNRLTIAIREIQKLLPADGEGGDPSQTRSQQEGDFGFRPGMPSSKLDVVEMAVGFIKDLKEKNTEMARRVRAAERRLEECHCRRARGDTSGDAAG